MAITSFDRYALVAGGSLAGNLGTRCRISRRCWVQLRRSVVEQIRRNYRVTESPISDHIMLEPISPPLHYHRADGPPQPLDDILTGYPEPGDYVPIYRVRDHDTVELDLDDLRWPATPLSLRERLQRETDEWLARVAT